MGPRQPDGREEVPIHQFMEPDRGDAGLDRQNAVERMELKVVVVRPGGRRLGADVAGFLEVIHALDRTVGQLLLARQAFG